MRELVWCSWVRVPGVVVLHCWGGGAANTASERKVGGDSVTKIILFYNGVRPTEVIDFTGVSGLPGEFTVVITRISFLGSRLTLVEFRPLTFTGRPVVEY